MDFKQPMSVMSFFSNLFSSKKASIEIAIPQPKQDTSQCPNCSHSITPIPTRKKRCPNCNNYIIVRTHYKTKERVLLTEAQIERFEIEKERHYTVTSFLRALTGLGIQSNIIDSLIVKHMEIFRSKSKEELSFADAVWSVSNQLIIKYPELSQGIHFHQATFLHREGKDPTKIRLLGFKEDLMEYRRSKVVTGVEVITAGEHSCENCRKLENKVFTIKEALEKEILPCKECYSDKNRSGIGWCRCCYAPCID